MTSEARVDEVPSDPPGAPPPPEDDVAGLRADARRNRARIIAAGRTVFARRGIDATLDDVAREADVGVGTVYRRFRDKGALAEAIFTEELEALIAEAEALAAVEDPWEAFVSFITNFVERQANNCGLRDIVMSGTVHSERCTTLKRHLGPLAEQIVARAQASGDLPADFHHGDIPVLGLILGGVSEFAGSVRPDLWRRYLTLVLEGLRAQAHSGAPSAAVPAPTEDEVRAMAERFRPHHGR